jgi:histidinol-phosphate phosphatase family protein
MNQMDKAVFLDRDGVLIENKGILTSENDIVLLPGIRDALIMLTLMQYKLIVISNQPAFPHNNSDIGGINRLQDIVTNLIAGDTGIFFDDFLFCPHHALHSDESDNNFVCQCRTPEPGLILDAASKHNLDLSQSIIIGASLTGCVAGFHAGCKTVLVRSNDNSAGTIPDSIDKDFIPDYSCDSLMSAARWIGEYC